MSKATLKVRNQSLTSAIRVGCMEIIKKTDIITYIYLCYKQWYYLGKPIVNDAEFDAFEDQLREADPTNPAFDVVGLLHPTCKCCFKK